MICKKCGKELPEGSILCCFCGEAVEEIPAEAVAEDAEAVVAAEEIAEEPVTENCYGEPKPEIEMKKGNQWWVILLACVAGVALLAVLVGAILFGLGLNPFAKPEETIEEDTTPATEQTTENVNLPTDGVYTKDNYTVEDDVARESRDVVVATIGEETLTSGELQIYYWETVMNFVNNNYYYLSAYGLDIASPLAEQQCPMTNGQTWEQYFLEVALSSWQRYTVLQLMAREAGYEMDEEMKSFLETLPESAQTNAINYGYENLDAWLEASCGPGVSQEGYMEYVNAYYEGTFYLTSRYDDLQPTAEEVEAYFDANVDMFESSGISKDSGKYYDVRHILIPIEGGTAAEDGTVTYSDEDWENCRVKAQALLDEWKEKDGTEAGFANYAMLNSTDGGSSSNGGLYEDLTAETSFVQEFKDWYLDEARQVGDTGLVKSTYGYHIMYFSGSSEIWFDTVSEEMLTERVSNLIDEGITAHPMEVDFEKIVIGKYEFA